MVCLDERPIAVQEEHRRSVEFAALNVVKTYPVAFDELAERRILAASPPSHQRDDAGGEEQRDAKSNCQFEH